VFTEVASEKVPAPFKFYLGVLKKFIYDVPKFMLGIRIPVQLDPDLIGQIRILERTMTVGSQLESESENPDFISMDRYSTVYEP
jgi:hypothetical protein